MFFFLTLGTSRQAKAQYDPVKVNPKADKLYLLYQQHAADEKFLEGIATLQQAVALDKNFEDAWLSIAGMYTELKNYQAASTVDEAHRIARSIDSIYFKDYSLTYSINLAGLGKFKEALAAVEDFKSVPNLHESSLRAAAYRKQILSVRHRLCCKKKSFHL